MAADPQTLARWWRTLRPIAPEQHAFRVAHEVRKRVWRPILPALVARWRARGAQVARGTDLHRLAGLGGRLRAAMGQESDAAVDRLYLCGVDMGPLDQVDWALPGCTPLQVYEAQYLDWTVQLARAGHTELLRRALARWAAHLHPKAWESYPRARRTLAGLRAASLLEPGALRSALLTEAAAAWLALPWLVERHLDGNHLLLDRTATAAGRALWRQDPRDLALVRELARQFDAEAGHVEGSAMYHAIACEDLLTVAALDEHGALDTRLHAVGGPVAWLGAVTHPDGALPGFGDSDATFLDQTPLCRAALARVHAPDLRGLGTAWTARTPGQLAVVHVAQPAWTPQPGHAHDDTLSVEWSCGGVRWLADAGLGGYERDPDRPLCRSAASHSTVLVDGQTALELWSTFRVGRRGVLRGLQTGSSGGWQWVAAMHVWAHSAAAGQGSGIRHRRLVASRDGVLLVGDQLFGPPTGGEQNWVCAPGVALAGMADGRLGLVQSPDRLLGYAASTAPLRIASGPRFARRRRQPDGPVLRVAVSEQAVWTTFSQAPVDPAAMAAGLQAVLDSIG